MERREYSETAARLICISFVVLAVYLLLKHGLWIVLPFLAAFCVGAPINMLSQRISKRSRISRKLCSVLLMAVVLSLVGVLIYYGLERLLLEARELVSFSEEKGDIIGKTVDGVIVRIDEFAKKLPILEALGRIDGLEKLKGSIDSGISGLFYELVDRLTASIPTFALEFVKRTPRALLTIFVTVLASFYFAIDLDGVKESVYAILPKRVAIMTKKGGGIVAKALKSYAKAYLLIMLITFLEVFSGLLILRIRYAFIIALGIAVIDLLPLFGTGAVLVPWALISFMLGDNGVGSGLLILYGVITIVRQLIEPKIVGSSLGIHPLITLFSMFCGLTLFGFFGMLLGPFVFLVIREAVKGVNKKGLE